MVSAPELLTGPSGIAADLQQGLVADDAPLHTQAALDPARPQSNLNLLSRLILPLEHSHAVRGADRGILLRRLHANTELIQVAVGREADQWSRWCSSEWRLRRSSSWKKAALCISSLSMGMLGSPIAAKPSKKRSYSSLHPSPHSFQCCTRRTMYISEHV